MRILALVAFVAVAGAWQSAPQWDDADWSIFQEKVEWARAQRLDTLPLGDAMAELGRSLVGTAYVPGTLEAEGPESLVINFRGLDCVTFVENVFALSRFVREEWTPELMHDRASSESRYEDLLTELRYRGGRIDGYPSRLHYFTDWIGDNEVMGLVTDVTEAVGGVHDAEPIDFMSTHTSAYRQLADPQHVSLIVGAEERLSGEGRVFVPAAGIDAAASGIRNGDIIAATSTVTGLDVAHTGLALWIDGELHLLHAPLVGQSVEISRLSLARRIAGIQGQDGIIVARPVER